jgi:hypothetical protein
MDLMHFIPKGEKEDKEDTNLRLVGDKAGNFSVQQKAEKKLQNIFQWTSAFLCYMKVYLMGGNNKKNTFDMLDYVEDIRFAATKWGGYGWRTYDEQFRVLMSSCPSMKWNEINQRLWLLHITPSALTPSTSGTGTSKSTPFSNRGSGFRPSGSTGSAKKAKEGKICYAFNKGQCTRGKSCFYEHKCECGEYGHGKNNCPKNKK